MRSWRYLNVALAFVVELAALVAVCVVGLTLDAGIGVRLLVGIGGPLLLAALWGYLAAPRAPHPLQGARGAVFRVLWFGTAALALVLSGREGWGVALMVVYLANAAVLRLTEPAPIEAQGP